MTGRAPAGAVLVACALVTGVLVAGCSSSGPATGSGGNNDGPSLSATAAAPVWPVGHAGRWLTDAAGRVLLPHGVDEVVKSAPWDPAAFGFTDEDAAWLADNGFALVRLGVMASAAMPAPGQIDTDYLDQLRTVAVDLGRHGILTLLDFHQDGWGPSFPGMDGFPPWMTVTGGASDAPRPFPDEYQNPAVAQAFASFWQDRAGPGGAGLQQDDATLLRAAASTFASVPSLLGYDVLNEPWPGTDASSCDSGDGCAALQASELAPFYAVADHAIRSADRTHLVFEEPFLQFDGGSVPVSLPLPGGDPAGGLSFHGYGSVTGTAGRGGGTSPGGTDPSAARAIEWSGSRGGALVESEWGATSDGSAIAAQADALDRAMVPWAYWAFDDCCGAPGSDSLIRSRSGPPVVSNANSAVVDALVRPYPSVVAGTPTAVSYDEGSRVLRVSWTDRAPRGGVFSPNSVTVIETPAAVYPDGYTVIADGAIVASAPCAPHLTVHLRSGTGSASVQVKPGGVCPRAVAASGGRVRGHSGGTGK
ncbi:MAG TPA: cellulase family glycosylhydrolase [Acidimicrobiales bacterium]|nr:cellulase family glycosylhydrolase [Acidimicrobiales bacterium]